MRGNRKKGFKGRREEGERRRRGGDRGRVSRAAGTVTRAMCLLCSMYEFRGQYVTGTHGPNTLRFQAESGRAYRKKVKSVAIHRGNILDCFNHTTHNEAQSSSFCGEKTSLKCPHNPRKWGSLYLPQPSTRRRSQCFGLAEISCDLWFFFHRCGQTVVALAFWFSHHSILASTVPHQSRLPNVHDKDVHATVHISGFVEVYLFVFLMVRLNQFLVPNNAPL